MSYRKKLIEVALPLDAINSASAREKSIRHGHPSTLHLWWSRKPLATCRAVLFASLIDDPSEHPELFPTEKEQEAERQRLFDLIEDLVKWENSNDEKILGQARAEILKSTGGNPPPVLDPFAGGGSIPLEAQRLGLEAHASDLNPVAVLINKALIEIPPKFAGQPPVNPEARKTLVDGEWRGTRGLADDVRYYGKWMRDEAERRIGHLYPKVTLPKEHGGGEATVIAWLWVRTITCPNPACGVQMPLANKWWLSMKKDKEAWIEPKVDSEKVISYTIHQGLSSDSQQKKVGLGTSFSDKNGKKTKATFKCIVCDVGIARGDYIDSEANAGRMQSIPVTIVAEGKQGRIYLPVNREQMREILEQTMQYLSDPAMQEQIPMEPARGTFASNAQGRIYGFRAFSNYFTTRQLTTLLTFCKLIDDVRFKIMSDANVTGTVLDNTYTDAVITYLAMAIDRSADFWSTLAIWSPQAKNELVAHTFVRQGLTMTWDFAEANPFSDSGGNFEGNLGYIIKVIQLSPHNPQQGKASQHDITTAFKDREKALVSTDPPYYDNVSYADLSDFFYVWLRRSLGSIYPELFTTMLVPKTQELVATPYRFDGNKSKAQQFFETGLQKAFERMRAIQNSDYPLTVYYAFKQAESEIDANSEESDNKNDTKVTASTGWETMLEGLIRTGFSITGTWPIRTERPTGVKATINALASSIVLVCRPRPENAPIASRRQFINELKAELPQALKKMQHGSIAPVDLAQASIGPGMAIYSKYSKVMESDGTPVRVRTALQLINRALDEVLAEQEGESDVETRWAIAWFETYAMEEGPYGQAETLSKAKNTAIQTLVEAGILEARAGKVRLLKPEEFPDHGKWQPAANARLTAWEVMQRAIYGLDKHGYDGAGNVLGHVGDLADVVRDLAYRLYTIL
jgi:putative DNA methylase